MTLLQEPGSIEGVTRGPFTSPTIGTLHLPSNSSQTCVVVTTRERATDVQRLSSAEHPTSLSRESPTRRRTLFEDLLGRPPEEEAHQVLASMQRSSAASLPGADQVSRARAQSRA